MAPRSRTVTHINCWGERKLDQEDQGLKQARAEECSLESSDLDQKDIVAKNGPTVHKLKWSQH